MKKMHGKHKRMKGLTRGQSHSKKPTTSLRGKLFKTSEEATAWAKEKKVPSFEIVSAKKDTKFRIATVR